MTSNSLDFEKAEPASFEELRVRDCSIKRTLDVIGEKWTLLVIREALYGARRFEQFLDNVGCARTLLSERLATLVEHGVLKREPYREPGQRERHQYLLTEKGLELWPVLDHLRRWGDAHYAAPAGPPVVIEHRGCGGEPDGHLLCDRCNEPLDAGNTVARPGPGAAQAAAAREPA